MYSDNRPTEFPKRLNIWRTPDVRPNGLPIDTSDLSQVSGLFDYSGVTTAANISGFAIPCFDASEVEEYLKQNPPKDDERPYVSIYGQKIYV